jgi:acetyltransferase-like isoleucine patch superfamily enzyme
MISIGKTTSVDDGVYLDDTGELVVGNECHIAKEVVIYTHNHGENTEWWKPKLENEINRTQLVIGDNVFIGRRVFILSSCHKIGNRVTIGACSVVTHDIPDNWIVAGNPARKIGEYENSIH